MGDGKRGAEPRVGLPGMVYENLTVREEGPRALDGKRTVYCDCKCGRTRFRTRVQSLTSGKTTSCGCVLDAVRKEIFARRGKARRRPDGTFTGGA